MQEICPGLPLQKALFPARRPLESKLAAEFHLGKPIGPATALARAMRYLKTQCCPGHGISFVTAPRLDFQTHPSVRNPDWGRSDHSFPNPCRYADPSFDGESACPTASPRWQTLEKRKISRHGRHCRISIAPNRRARHAACRHPGKPPHPVANLPRRNRKPRTSRSYPLREEKFRSFYYRKDGHESLDRLTEDICGVALYANSRDLHMRESSLSFQSAHWTKIKRMHPLVP